jgi:hypothetical protein
MGYLKFTFLRTKKPTMYARFLDDFIQYNLFLGYQTERSEACA